MEASITALIIIFIYFWITLRQDSGKNPIVLLDSGSVEGIGMTSYKLGRKFNSFLSIPYAEPPLGAQRFMPPEPKKPWNGVFKADRMKIMCPQFLKIILGNHTEDCLVLNVYSPQLVNYGPLLPVMVVIHEGGFISGTGSYAFYRPEKFMDHDVLLVSFNYRLGLFGFLNTQDESSAGNCGMLDQVLALKWIRDNIQAFGGDPGKVTIFGASAGGASVGYHMLSPLSTGLFHSAIAASGSPLSPGLYQSQPRRYVYEIGEVVNCSSLTTSTKDLVDCLRTKTVEEIYQATISLVKYYSLFNVGPSVEGSSGQGFLTARPLDLMRQGQINKVPFITGAVKDEGTLIINNILDFNKYSGKRFLDQELCEFISSLLDVDLDQDMQRFCLHSIDKFMSGFDIENPTVLKARLMQLLGDYVLNSGVSKTAELFSAAGIPTQVYRLTYVLDANVDMGNFTSHCDDMILILDRHWSIYDNINFTKNDHNMGDLIIHMWTQFAINQNNSVEVRPLVMDQFEWPIYDSKSQLSREYLEMNLNPQIKSGLLCDYTEFCMEELTAINKI